MTIDDLKSCGNCLHREAFEFDEQSHESCKLHSKPSCECCGAWKFDGMTYAARMNGNNL